ncbi:MAG: hypothetical protein AAGD13_15530 [Pseudomonadota bacterium]
MTHPKDDRDKELDALVRAASAAPTDEVGTYYKVLSRIDAAPRPALIPLPGLSPNLALASFAALMLAAGAAGYALPDLTTQGADDQILALAFGITDAAPDPFAPTVAGTGQ